MCMTGCVCGAWCVSHRRVCNISAPGVGVTSVSCDRVIMEASAGMLCVMSCSHNEEKLCSVLFYEFLQR